MGTLVNRKGYRQQASFADIEIQSATMSHLLTTVMSLVFVCGVTVVNAGWWKNCPGYGVKDMGCYRDADDRDLTYGPMTDNDITPDKCVQDCLSQGYHYAGVQHGNECFCGHSYGKHGQVEDRECDMPCSGADHLKCGGPWANRIYSTGLDGKQRNVDLEQERDKRLIYQEKCWTSEELPNGCECFGIHGDTPFSNVWFPPQSPADVGTKFFLYNKDVEGAAIKVPVGSDTGYDTSRPTVVLCHGWNGDAVNGWEPPAKDELLKEGSSNIILVDWHQGATANGWNMIPYFQSASNTRTVGAMIARLLQDLHELGTDYKDIHLVGHSLGAQVVGYAGQEIQRLEGTQLGRITGLDPAGPAFEKYSDAVKLSKSDAAFVDVIHSNAKRLPTGFGDRKSCGDVDFWPNGGIFQPGCDVKGESTWCSHQRAWRYWINSINKCDYSSGNPPCRMGFHTKTTCRGDYRDITTSSTAPYC